MSRNWLAPKVEDSSGCSPPDIFHSSSSPKRRPKLRIKPSNCVWPQWTRLILRKCSSQWEQKVKRGRAAVRPCVSNYHKTDLWGLSWKATSAPLTRNMSSFNTASHSFEHSQLSSSETGSEAKGSGVYSEHQSMGTVAKIRCNSNQGKLWGTSWPRFDECSSSQQAKFFGRIPFPMPPQYAASRLSLKRILEPKKPGARTKTKTTQVVLETTNWNLLIGYNCPTLPNTIQTQSRFKHSHKISNRCCKRHNRVPHRSIRSPPTPLNSRAARLTDQQYKTFLKFQIYILYFIL